MGALASRRQFLGGAVLGAISLSAPAGLRPAPAVAADQRLTPQRRRVYAALVAAVLVQPEMRLDPRAAHPATEAFATAYAGWPVEQRRRADAVLDELARRNGTPAAALRARASSDEPFGAEAAQLDLARRAHELVAVAVGPDEEAV